MTRKAVFYHAGCSVCRDAELQFADSLDPTQYEVEVVHLGEAKDRIGEAEAAGVKSVPAFIIDGRPHHINFGANSLRSEIRSSFLHEAFRDNAP